MKWHNTEHLHSSTCFVTPADRHFGREKHILEKRRKVYAKGCRKNPKRWSKNIRNWKPVGEVRLNQKHPQEAPLKSTA